MTSLQACVSTSKQGKRVNLLVFEPIPRNWLKYSKWLHQSGPDLAHFCDISTHFLRLYGEKRWSITPVEISKKMLEQ